MATATELITDALEEINAIQPGETPAPEDSAVGLRKLRQLIDLWATQRLTITTVTGTTWTISANDGEYTVGTGGNVNVARPATTDVSVNIIDTSTTPDTRIPLTPATDEGWRAIPQPAVTAVWPAVWYYNPTFGVTGFGTLSLWPIPTSTTLQGEFWCPVAMTEPTALATVIYTPPGYRTALVTNLAIALCSSFEKVPKPTLVQMATDSLAWLKRSNIRLSDLSIDIALTRPHAPKANVYTGIP